MIKCDVLMTFPVKATFFIYINGVRKRLKYNVKGLMMHKLQELIYFLLQKEEWKRMTSLVFYLITLIFRCINS